MTYNGALLYKHFRKYVERDYIFNEARLRELLNL